MKKILYNGFSFLIILAIAASVIPVQLFHEHKEVISDSVTTKSSKLLTKEVVCCDVHEEALRFTAIIPQVDKLFVRLPILSIHTTTVVKKVILSVFELKNKAPPVLAA